MLGYILLFTLNVSLYFGIVRGDENMLNIAEFFMWAIAMLYLLIMFTSEKHLLKEPKKNAIFIWFNRLLISISVMHLVYWGYFFSAGVIFFSTLILIIRKYELDNRK